MLLKREMNLQLLPDCLRVLAGATLRTMNASLNRLFAPIALAAILSGCVKTSAQNAPPPPPQVTVANVIERDVTEWDEFTGRLQAVDSVDVRPRVSGFVSAVHFSEGAMSASPIFRKIGLRKHLRRRMPRLPQIRQPNIGTVPLNQ